MPYKIIEEHKGCFKVQDPKHKTHVFSKKCQTKGQAQKQRTAIALSEARKTGKSVSTFFV
jgi:hypothetical protein